MQANSPGDVENINLDDNTKRKTHNSQVLADTLNPKINQEKDEFIKINKEYDNKKKKIVAICVVVCIFIFLIILLSSALSK